MIKPKTLKPGDKIALIAPSSPVGEEKLAMSLESVRFFGLEPVQYPSCTMKHGYLSGPDCQRAKDVNDAFSNPDIDGIFCLRGGYGATRILAMLDYESIKRNPKLLIGYSDITAIHLALNQLCGIASLHSPMPTRGWDTLDPLTEHYLKKALFDSKPVGRVYNPEDEPIEVINPGIAKGIMVGGNLSLLTGTLGSKYEVDTRGKILFIEDVDERPYRLDKGLTALALAGKFTDCAGIILGTWAGCTEPENDPDALSPSSLSLRQIFDEVVKPFGKPTINNFRAGHIYPHISIPMGCMARLNATDGTVEFLEAVTA